MGRISHITSIKMIAGKVEVVLPWALTFYGQFIAVCAYAYTTVKVGSINGH